MNKKLEELQKTVSSILHAFISEEIKNPPEDLIAATKEIGNLATQAIKANYSGLLEELKDQMEIILEIYRIRLNKKAKKVFWQILEAVIKVSTQLLK
jgi:mRNA-degrading endonuclease RelE of RelBE toxin-antitoxin system